tara:strand:- start:2547 stop:2687 length:141 start_codon:yes stop_codon:yes gene_type:complete
MKTKHTIEELKELVSLLEYREKNLFINESILMVGDLDKLKKLIYKL